MPELPDVEILKKEADKAKGATIESAEVDASKMVNSSQSGITRFLKDKEVKGTLRHGKYLFLNVGHKEALVMHFGMTGELKYAGHDEKEPEYTQFSLNFKNNDHLHYISRRKLGRIEITDDTDKYIRDAGLGVDAVEVSEEIFLKNLQKNQSAIKSFLMNQSHLAGIGNIYSDEILFQAGIYPKKKAGKLTEEEGKKIYEKMDYVLKTAIDKEADVSSFPDSFLLSHRQEGKKCPGCNGKIQKIKVSGRAGYYCPGCQKKNN